MTQVTELTTQYVAEDGTRFGTKAACEAYEAELKSYSYFRVIHSPDLTEGRGWYGLTVLKVKAVQNGDEALVQDWCYKTFGGRAAFVQGVSYTENWRIYAANANQWKDPPHISVGDYKYPGTRKKLVQKSPGADLTEED